jgi:hypothetical protein
MPPGDDWDGVLFANEVSMPCRRRASPWTAVTEHVAIEGQR